MNQVESKFASGQYYVDISFLVFSNAFFLVPLSWCIKNRKKFQTHLEAVMIVLTMLTSTGYHLYDIVLGVNHKKTIYWHSLDWLFAHNIFSVILIFMSGLNIKVKIVVNMISLVISATTILLFPESQTLSFIAAAITGLVTIIGVTIFRRRMQSRRHHTPSGTRDVVILLDYIDLTAAIACIAIGFGLLLASRREYPNKEWVRPVIHGCWHLTAALAAFFGFHTKDFDRSCFCLKNKAIKTEVVPISTVFGPSYDGQWKGDGMDNPGLPWSDDVSWARAIYGMINNSRANEEHIYWLLRSRTGEEISEIESNFNKFYAEFYQNNTPSAFRDALFDRLTNLYGERISHILDRAVSEVSIRWKTHQILVARDEQREQKGCCKSNTSVSTTIFRIICRSKPEELRKIVELYKSKNSQNIVEYLRMILPEQLLSRCECAIMRATGEANEEKYPIAKDVVQSILSKGTPNAVMTSLTPLVLEYSSTEEKVSMIRILLGGQMNNYDEELILYILETCVPTPQNKSNLDVIVLLNQSGLLDKLLSCIRGVEYELLLEILPLLVFCNESAIALISRFSSKKDERHELAIHRVLDSARMYSIFESIPIDIFPKKEFWSDLINPQLRPIIVAHRGGPREFPENTEAALRASIRRGFQGIEIDLCFTQDNHVVLFHDATPEHLETWARWVRLEEGMMYTPDIPNRESEYFRPVHMLTLEELRDYYHFTGPDGRAKVEIPTLMQILPLLAHFKQIILDIKVPKNSDSQLSKKFAAQILEIVQKAQSTDPTLQQRIILLNNDSNIIENMQQILSREEGWLWAVDREDLNRFSWFGLRNTKDLDLADVPAPSDVISAGNPKAPWGHGFDDYVNAMKRARRSIDNSGNQKKLIAWTLDEELKIRAIVGVGVDLLLTGYPEEASNVLSFMFPSECTVPISRLGLGFLPPNLIST